MPTIQNDRKSVVSPNTKSAPIGENVHSDIAALVGAAEPGMGRQ